MNEVASQFARGIHASINWAIAAELMDEAMTRRQPLASAAAMALTDDQLRKLVKVEIEEAMRMRNEMMPGWLFK